MTQPNIFLKCQVTTLAPLGKKLSTTKRFQNKNVSNECDFVIYFPCVQCISSYTLQPLAASTLFPSSLPSFPPSVLLLLLASYPLPFLFSPPQSPRHVYKHTRACLLLAPRPRTVPARVNSGARCAGGIACVWMVEYRCVEREVLHICKL